jgi:hypothetical protein
MSKPKPQDAGSGRTGTGYDGDINIRRDGTEDFVVDKLRQTSMTDETKRGAGDEGSIEITGTTTTTQTMVEIIKHGGIDRPMKE